MALARVRISLTAGIALLALLAACAAPVTLQNRFDPAEAAYAVKPGTGTVEGEAFVRKFNGRIANAAGLAIYLVPVTPYTTELMQAVETGSGVTALSGELDDYARGLAADSKGRFKFERIPPGDYYLLTQMTWSERAGKETLTFYKGLVMQVTMAAGEHKKVSLSGAAGRR